MAVVIARQAEKLYEIQWAVMIEMEYMLWEAQCVMMATLADERRCSGSDCL